MPAKKDKEVSSGKTKILIVDDHPIVREGLIKLLEQEDDFEVCGSAEDDVQALKAIDQLRPNIAIVDISLKSSSGIDLTKSIKSQYPKLAVLVLSMHSELVYAERALRAGAKGYIMKQEATKKLITAVRQILDDQIYISEEITKRIMSQVVGGKAKITDSPIDNLSDRELEVFQYIGQGYGTREIADKLYLSVKTVETYRTHIKEKLNCSNSSELLRYAVQWYSSQQGS